MFSPQESALYALLAHGDKRLPVNTLCLCDDYGIPPQKDLERDFRPSTKGICFIYKKTPHIIIRSDLERPFERFVCAHEIGHLLQGHVGHWGFAAYNANLPRNKRENAANEFALEMVAPQCLLLALGITSADQIAALCDIPDEYAQQAMEALQRRKQENPTLSYLEMAVVEQFSEFLYEKGVWRNAPTH